MNCYELSRVWFDWCFENPEKVSPNHSALYFFAIEHCNRLGWKDKFGLPTTMAKEAIGIKSYNTYIKTLNELVDFGFITMIETSKNQYSSNIIALSKNDKAPNKALDKALIKHTTKQSESTGESNSSIDKPINNKQIVVVEDSEESEKNIQKPESENILTDEFFADEEEKAAAFDFLKNNQLYILSRQQHQLSELEVKKLFSHFFDLKSGLNELNGKSKMDVIKNFFYWVPKHKLSLKKENGTNNANPRPGSGSASSPDQKRAERGALSAIARNVLQANGDSV